ncbi:LamG-like jellyroll fold domain-containing protein, partial [Nonomuraea thailandensis]
LWGEHFNGLIDEVRIYNRALSTTEIQTDMSTPL